MPAPPEIQQVPAPRPEPRPQPRAAAPSPAPAPQAAAAAGAAQGRRRRRPGRRRGATPRGLSSVVAGLSDRPQVASQSTAAARRRRPGPPSRPRSAPRSGASSSRTGRRRPAPMPSSCAPSWSSRSPATAGSTGIGSSARPARRASNRPQVRAPPASRPMRAVRARRAVQASGEYYDALEAIRPITFDQRTVAMMKRLLLARCCALPLALPGRGRPPPAQLERRRHRRERRDDLVDRRPGHADPAADRHRRPATPRRSAARSPRSSPPTFAAAACSARSARADCRAVAFAEVTAPDLRRLERQPAPQTLVQGFVQANARRQLTVGCYLYDVAAPDRAHPPGLCRRSRATGAAPRTNAPTPSIRACPARAPFRQPDRLYRRDRAARTGGSSGSRSWIRTAPTTAS